MALAASARLSRGNKAFKPAHGLQKGSTMSQAGSHTHVAQPSTSLRSKRRHLHTCATSSEQAAFTWCNPTDSVVRQVRENVWVGDRPFVWNGIDVGGRMTFLKLSDGSLMAFSPLQLDDEMRSALEDIGPVKHIVSPNFEHVSKVKGWIKGYPDATSYGCPGLKEQEPDIPFDYEVGSDNTGPGPWPDEVKITFLSHEEVPVLKKPFFREIILFHETSKVLLTTDFFWNFPKGVPGGTKLFKFAMDKIYKPFYFKLMIKDKVAYKDEMARIFSQPWDTIIPCHGNIVEQNAKQALREFVGMS